MVFLMRLDKEISKLFKNIIDANTGWYKTTEIRIEEVEAILDRYKKISNAQRGKLSTYILKEDKRKRKGKGYDNSSPYPFLSNRQFRSRKEREAGSCFIDVLDSEGNLHIPPTRTERINSEMKEKRIKF